MSDLFRLVPLMAVAGLSVWADPQIGAAAPPLSLSRVLQAQNSQATSWIALRGQAVVIEFWATWCPGCREQIAHLNALEQRFRGRPLRFLSITDEDPDLVLRFLKDAPISGWIGIDAAGKTVQDYGIIGWPTTVLVDSAGIVQGVGNASELNAPVLEALLARQPVTFTRTTGKAVKLQAVPEPFFQLMLRPAAPTSISGYSPGALSGVRGKKWEAWGVPVSMVLAEAYGVPEDRIQSAAGIDWDRQARFDVSVAAPELTDIGRRDLLRRLVETTFKTSTRTVPRETDVLVLESTEEQAHRLRPSSSSSSRGGVPGNIIASATPMAGIVALASRTTGKMVLDETGLAGRYDFELRWDVRDPNSFAEAIHSQLGLRLSAKRRFIDHLVVDSLTIPANW